MTPPRALLLDLDNTLVDRDAALLAWLAQLVPALDEATREALVACDGGGYGNKGALFARLATLSGRTTGDLRRCFAGDFPRHARLKPDADALLRRFPGRTVIVTNGDGPIQRAKLAAAGLAGRVGGVVVSGELGVHKPAAAIFHAALALAGCAADEALMVGDHPHFDVGGARAAGIDGVLVRTRWFDVPSGGRAIAQLTELLA